MAKVIITIEDVDEDKLDVTMDSDPGFPGPAAEDSEYSIAQSYALLLIEHLTEAIKEAGEEPVIQPN